MIARISTDLDAPAGRVWALLRRKETLLYVTRGLMRFSGAERWPEEWREDKEAVGRIWLFHVIPGWRHRIRLVSAAEERHELRTEERGGPVEVWNHRLQVTPLSSGHSRYTDEIEIRAGALTPVVWAFAHVFYRYRQARWRALAKVLG